MSRTDAKWLREGGGSFVADAFALAAVSITQGEDGDRGVEVSYGEEGNLGIGYSVA